MTGEEIENRINELRDIEEKLLNEIEDLKEEVAIAKVNNLTGAAMGKKGRETQTKVKGDSKELNKTIDIAISAKKTYEKKKKELIQKEKEVAIIQAQLCAAEQVIPIIEEAQKQGKLD